MLAIIAIFAAAAPAQEAVEELEIQQEFVMCGEENEESEEVVIYEDLAEEEAADQVVDAENASVDDALAFEE